MYIYGIECEVEWSNFEDGDDYDVEYYDIAAKNSTQALLKLNKIALAKSRGFKDGETGERIYPVRIEDVIKLERGDFIDG